MNDEELPDTQKVCDVVWTQTQNLSPPAVWGKLFSMQEEVPSLEMSKDSYTFGRAVESDVVFNNNNIKKRWVGTISKSHFKITRELLIGSDGLEQNIVLLHDTSQNGTYVNFDRIGKNNKVRLRNDDIISMSEPEKLKVYIYMDEKGLESSDYPVEVTNKFTISRTLGSGACGEVKMAFCKQTDQKVAIKIISRKNIDFEDSVADPQKILNEINILKQLKHPCVVNMIDFIDTTPKMYIVLELMEGGELLDRIRKKRRIVEKTAKVLFYQVVLAVQYLHMKGIAHRDLKPENILLATHEDETLVKVTDFGLSKLMGTSMMKTFCGTPMYVAPEILQHSGRGFYTNQVDLWSMGVILYCCLSGVTPFSTRQSVSLQEQIISGTYNFPKAFFGDVSANAISLIKRMMTVNPQKRIKIDDALHHPWFVDRIMHITVNKIFEKLSEDNCPHILNDFERDLERGVAKRAKISSDDK